MSQNSPWSVKSVTQDARDAAKQAARRAGLTIGEWLSQTILVAAENEVRENALPDAGNGEGGAITPEGGSTSLPSTPLPAAIAGEIQELRDGYVDLEERIYDTLEPLMQRVRRLSAQMTELQYASGRMEGLSSIQDKVRDLQRLSREVDGIPLLQEQVRELQRNPYDPGALRHLQDQIRDIERRAQDNSDLRKLQEQIREVQQQAQSGGNTQDLENQLYLLTKRVENMGKGGGGGGGSPEQYEELSDMIEQIKQASQHQITEQTGKLNDLSREIEQIRSESGSSAATTGPMERALSRLDERVQKLEEGQPESKGGLFG